MSKNDKIMPFQPRQPPFLSVLSIVENWLQANGFKEKNEWPQISPDLNLLDCWYHVWDATLEKYHKLQPKPKTTDELKVALHATWQELPQEDDSKVAEDFTKHLAANSGHFRLT